MSFTDSYTIQSGVNLYLSRTGSNGGGGGGGTTPPGSIGMPAYVAAAPLMMAGVVPSSYNAPGGLMVYSGWVYAEGMFINPGFYGHHDGSDNGVYGFLAATDTPQPWQTLCDPTPEYQRTSDAAYYADGKPSAPHGYFSTVFVPSTREIWRIGKRSTWSDPNIPGSSTSQFPNIDVWNKATGEWRPAQAPFANPAVGPVPNLVGQNGSAVISNSEKIFSGSLGYVTDPVTGLTRPRSGTGNAVGRYPQANNKDDNYILNFTVGDGGEGSTSGVVASMLVAETETLIPLTVNPSAAFSQLQADNPFGPGLTWCKPLNQWLFYHGMSGRQNTVYALTVNTVAKTVDVSILTIQGYIPVNIGGVYGKFTYVDELGALFLLNDASVGINFVRMK